MANANDEEIIEKRPSHPIATACLILAALGLLGAIAFQIAEISNVRSGLTQSLKTAPNPADKFGAQISKELENAIQEMEKANEHGDIKATVSEKDVGEAPPVPEEKADAATKADKPADEKPADEKAEKADKPADEKPADEKADKPADEKPADEKAEKPADEKPADEKAEKPADEKPADEKPADEKSEEKPEEK